MGKWVATLSQEKDKTVRRAGFLALWLSKFFFSEFPRYGIKSTFFPFAIKLARGTQYSLAPMFLGHVYSQLDLFHDDEIEGNSCYTITSSLHCAILQVFMCDRFSVALAKCKNLKYVKDKFQGSPNVIKGLCGCHGFKNRYSERTEKGTSYRFSGWTEIQLMVEPMTS